MNATKVRLLEREMTISALCRHDVLRTANLTLDLLASPSGGFDSARREVPVRLGLLDQSSHPVLAESLGQLSVGIGISQVTLKIRLANHDVMMNRGRSKPTR
jgi:hypothetical protein